MMWNDIADVLARMFDVKSFTAFVIVLIVGMAFVVIRLVTESTLLAAIYTPAMGMGALAANYLFNVYFLGPLDDRDANIVVAAAVGVVAAMLLMLVATRFAILMSDRRRRRQSARLAGAVHLSTGPSDA